jgi:hypothetical protein
MDGEGSQTVREGVIRNGELKRQSVGCESRVLRRKGILKRKVWRVSEASVPTEVVVSN